MKYSTENREYKCVYKRKKESMLSSTKTYNSFSRKNYLYLTLSMAIMDFKIKYDSSLLGYLWSLLKPLLMFGTLYLVFSVFVRWQVENYKLYLLLGIILWGFLAEVTQNSMALQLAKGPILKKIYFPRWILVISSSLTSVLTLLLNLIVFFIFFLLSKASFTPAAWWLFVFLIELYLLSVGLAFVLCAFYPKFRDISHIWEVFVQLGFWITPIIYPITVVPEKYHRFIFLNPVARIIQGSRQAIIGYEGHFLSPVNHLYVMAIAVAVLAFGIVIFNRMAPEFSEDL